MTKIIKDFDDAPPLTWWEEQDKRTEKRRRINYNLSVCNIPIRFKEHSFETFNAKTEDQKHVKDKCFNYAENFDKFYEKGTSMILCGPPGTGKTLLSVSIIKYVIENKESSAKFINTVDLICKIKASWNKNSEETEEQAIDEFVSPDLLVLDEAGVQFGSNTEQLLLDRIINKRYENLEPTIIITNLNFKNLKKIIGERVVDRLRENNGEILVFKGNSYRSTKNET